MTVVEDGLALAGLAPAPSPPSLLSRKAWTISVAAGAVATTVGGAVPAAISCRAARCLASESAKAAAFWYRTQWLLTQGDSQADKPFKTGGKHEVHIVESWESPAAFNQTKNQTTRAIHAYSSALNTQRM